MTSVRRVRRIIRKFDPWTVLKVSLVLYAIMGLALVLGLVIVWSVVNAVEIPQKIESFFTELAIFDATNIVPDSEQLLRTAVFLSIAWTVFMTGMTTLTAVMYNLVSDVVGGIEVVVLEETMNLPAAQPQVRPPASWQTAAPSPGKVTDSVDQPTEEVATTRR
jgi:hypothetical protein